MEFAEFATRSAEDNDNYGDEMAECVISTEESLLEDPRDPYYSCQGQCGTCVRHALAKAIQYQLRSGEMEIITRTDTLIGILLSTRPISPKKGAVASDWHGSRLSFQDQQTNGHEFELIVTRIDLQDPVFVTPPYAPSSWVGSCVSCDMYIFNTKPRHPKNSRHCMFCIEDHGDEVLLRNSWGNKHKHILVPKTKCLARCIVFVRNMENNIFSENIQLYDQLMEEEANRKRQQEELKRAEAEKERKRLQPIDDGDCHINCNTHRDGWRYLEAFPREDAVRLKPKSSDMDQRWTVKYIGGGLYTISCATRSGDRRYLEAFPVEDMVRPRGWVDNRDQRWTIRLVSGSKYLIFADTINGGRRAVEAFPKDCVIRPKVLDASNGDQLWEFDRWL